MNCICFVHSQKYLKDVKDYFLYIIFQMYYRNVEHKTVEQNLSKEYLREIVDLVHHSLSQYFGIVLL